MEYEIPVTKDNLTEVILTILNFNLGMSKLEIKIIATLLDNGYIKVNIDARDIIRKVLDLDKFSTNNYIKRLRTKGILLEKPNDKQFYINPGILQAVESKDLSFKFNVND